MSALLGLGLALGLAWLAVGCVRLSKPDHFLCSSDADCDSGDKCVDNACFAVDYCKQDAHCQGDQRCLEERCVAAQCSPTTAASRCQGFACTSQRTCLTSCLRHEDCADGFHCVGVSCKAGAVLGDGQACTINSDCSSVSCCVEATGSVCRNACKRATGAACTTGQDCSSGNCCKDASGMSSCSDGACVRPPPVAEACRSDQDCGESPWGVPNQCETNDAGEKICFPGCTTSQQCFDNLGADFVCSSTYESDAWICK